jgi:hypothetical protein
MSFRACRDVIQSPFTVILSAAEDLCSPLRVNSARNLALPRLRELCFASRCGIIVVKQASVLSQTCKLRMSAPPDDCTKKPPAFHPGSVAVILRAPPHCHAESAAADEASRPAVARQKSPERDSSLRSALLRMTAWQTSVWMSRCAAWSTRSKQSIYAPTLGSERLPGGTRFLSPWEDVGYP